MSIDSVAARKQSSIRIVVNAKTPASHGDVLPVVFIVLAVAAAFAGSLSGGFLNWDDDRNFVQNPAYRALGVEQLRWAFTTFHLGVWQPLAWLLFSLQYQLFGLDPRGYHAVSVVLHAACAVSIYFIAQQCMIVRNTMTHDANRLTRWIFAGVVVCFAVHPMRVEAVAWISGQPYLPSILCCLACVLWYLRHHASGARAEWRTWAVPLAFYLAAVGFKAVAVTLPIVLIVLDVFPLRRWERGAAERRRALLEKAPLLLVTLVVCWLALRAKEFNASRAPLHEFDASVRTAQAAAGVWFYLLKTLVPVNLSPYYRLPDDLSLSKPLYLLALVGVVSVTIILLRWRRTYPALWAAWLIHLVVLLPNLGLIQISQQLAADRYGYLALIGWAVVMAGGLATGVARLALRWRATVVALLGLIAAWSLAATRTQAAVWRSSQALWQAALSVDPDCAVAHCNLGEDLVRRGEYAEASRHLSRAIDLDASFAFAYVNLGVVLIQARQFEEAARCGEQALAREGGLTGSDRGRAHAMLGQAYAGLKRDDEAWRHTREALRLGFEPARQMLEYLSDISPPRP